MAFRFVTADEQDDNVAAALIDREREIANYELNEANYQRMLAAYTALPDEWPESIRQFKGKQSQSVAAQLNDDAYQLLSQYEHRDQLRVLLRTTKAEKAKSQAVLDALEAGLPKERIDAAVARVNAARARVE